MKKICVIFPLLLSLISCKQEKTRAVEEVKEELSVLDSIAMAHGFEHWQAVDEIEFTFNVDRDTSHFERSWKWVVRSGEVTNTTASDTVAYYRNELDTLLQKIDAGFINDKYWLLAPFNLVWDRGNFRYDLVDEAISPINREPMKKLTVMYSNEGGYTPGDAYDLFVDDNYRIQEWIFRKGNQQEPSLITTWEDYKEYGGLIISTSHRQEEGSWRLYFTDISVN